MTLPSDLSKDDISERFAIFRKQETTVYACGDYLSAEHQAQAKNLHSNNNLVNGNVSHTMNPSEFTVSSSSSSSSKTGINEFWREKICEWSFQVIDHFDFSREIVSISLNYLDRYLSVCIVNKKKFQLAAVTCIYIALKLYGSSSLKISSFVELSRGYFTVDHIIAMEDSILRTLSWYMNPPTSLNAVRHFLNLYVKISPPKNDYYLSSRSNLGGANNNNNSGPSMLHEVQELSRFLTELSVCDYFFVKHNATDIGLAAVLAAIDIVTGRSDPPTLDEFLVEVKSYTCCDPQSDEVLSCKGRLKETYIMGDFVPDADKEVLDGDISPVCVSKAN